MHVFIEHLERYRTTAIFVVVGMLVLFALFFSRKGPGMQANASANAMCLQGRGCNPSGMYPAQPGYAPQMMPQNNCLMYPAAPGCPMASSVIPLQPVALQSGTIKLAMGVVLEGRGTVVSVEPGSAAERAGIQPGDLINRINGK